MSTNSAPQPSASAIISTGKRRFVKNTVFSVGHQLTAMTIALLLLPFMLWRLGTEKYGLWLTLQIFTMSGLVSLAELGFQGAIMRYLVKYHTENDHAAFRRLLVTGFFLFFGIGLACSLGLFAFGHFLFLDAFDVAAPYREEMLTAFYVYAAALLYGFPALVLKAFYAGTQNFAALKTWETAERILFAGAVVVLLFSVDRILPLVLLEQGLAIAMFLLFFAIGRLRYRRLFSINPRYAAARSLRGVIGMSGLMFLNNASWLVYLKVPDALIGSFLGPVHLAYYSIIVRIPRAMKAFQGALNAAALPFAAMLESIEGGGSTRRNLALKGMRFSFLLFMPLACVIFVFAEEILHLWVGGQYSFLGIYLRTFMLWQLLAFLVAFGGTTFTRAEHYRQVVWKNLAVNVIFLLLVLWWIEPYRLNGVLAALMIGGIATALVNLPALRAANGFSYGEFYRTVVRGPIVIGSAIGLTGFGLVKLVLLKWGPAPAAAAMAAFGVLYLWLCYRFLLYSAERTAIGDLWRAVAPGKRAVHSN